MTVREIQAPHRMKCENCDVGFAKLVKTDELINGKKHCVYYCEHCKNYQLYEQVEHQPKRFTEQKVKETLNEAFDKNFSNSEILLMWIATELGVELND